MAWPRWRNGFRAAIEGPRRDEIANVSDQMHSSVVPISALILFGASAISSSGFTLSEAAATELFSSLSRAQAQLDLATQCARNRLESDAVRRADEVEGRIFDAYGQIESVWALRRPEPGEGADETLQCGPLNSSTAFANADREIANFHQKFNQAVEIRSRGLWLGPIKLCSASVVDSRIERIEWTGQDALNLTLTPPATEIWGRITSRAVNLKLNVSLDGKTISSPNVNEEILSGELTLSGPELRILQEAQRTSSQACEAVHE